METNTLLLILIPSAVSLLLAAATMVFTHSRDKRKRKEKVWDLAERITLAYIQHQRDGLDDVSLADETIAFFERAYRLLKAVDGGSFGALLKASGEAQSTERS